MTLARKILKLRRAAGFSIVAALRGGHDEKRRSSLQKGGTAPGNRTGRGVRLAKMALVTVAALAFTTFFGAKFGSYWIGPPPLDIAGRLSVTVLDRNDRLLRAFTTDDGRWRLPVEVADVDKRYLAILFAFEDNRFYQHGGVDYLAMIRASLQLIGNGRIISGGSTITMQVARLLDGQHERTALGKLRQILRAWQLEAKFSKDEILRLYLRLAPFGGNIEGVRAASLAYFGKEPRRLSVGEAALLVALPQSPETRRPDRNPAAARQARDRVLARAADAGVISAAEVTRAVAERVPQRRRPFTKLAPHLSESEVASRPAANVHSLTIDRDLQRELEKMAHEQTALLGSKLSAAILVADHLSGEILAYVGSSDYLDGTRLGAIDMVQAVRSPGSTLKPVIYGLAFEGGLAHPETLIEDRPARFGNYAPKNFDDEFHGTVTVRSALANSLNIPAVKLLEAVGPGRLAGRFRRIGLTAELPDGAAPSLAIALGGIGMRLQDLTAMYAAMARGGDPIRLTFRRHEAMRRAEPQSKPGRRDRLRRLMSPVAAWYVTDVLKDAPPPPSSRGGRIAYKTGTSYGYRDAWAIGYDGQYTIGVWAGRADGTSTPGLMGRTAAAPMLFDAFARLGESRAPLIPAPAGALQVSGALLPPPLKRFGAASEQTRQGVFKDPPVLIAFPHDRSELEIEAGQPDPVLLKAEGGTLPLTWLIDGAPLRSEPHQREAVWQPDGRGFAKLSVVDAKGRVDRVTVRLK